MPIANIQDAQEVERSLQSILTAHDIDARIQTVRTLFVEILDYDPADQRVSLGPASNDQLPDDAYIVARRDGVSAVYVPLDDTTTNRVTGTAASAAAKVIGNALADEPLLLFTNRDGDQLHIIRPDLVGNRPRLQRIVAHRNQHQRTVVQQIANMWDDYGNRGKTISDAIANAFSVEPVTKDFFETYREIFEDAKTSISGFGGGKADQEDKHLFTQTLFNRLMFVYFLSRKGWLKFNGHTDYLNALWQDHKLLPSRGNFYTTRLRLLFFSGLNNPNSMDLTQRLAALIGEVPFLNGGLFEETDLDRREGITVPDETIEQVLIGMFDRFNFTITESTPFDVEVAVDPEMLGKVFEELVTGRHDSGAYYTPRPVVSFMCREALKGYLEGQETGVDADAIAQFVDRQDPSSLNLSAARRISEALTEVTAVDPACGSGAYLLGMMQELIELQTTLYNVGVDSKAVYELKLEIIQRNLYGVDIDEFAVNIAMLRMWLSLAIDFEGESPPPLPNLDFKVLCGDSLRGPDPSAGVEVQGTLGRDADRIKQLGELKGEYLRASDGSKKASLRQEIGKLTEEIRQALGNVGVDADVVDWRVEFAEVLNSGRGFDIAIANPPYINVETLTAETKAHLYANYETCERRTDIYVAFLERSLGVLNSNGLLSFIIPASLTKQKYATKMRQKLIEQHSIRQLIDASSYRIFDAVVYNVVLTVGKAKRGNLTQVRIHTSNDDFENFSGAEFLVEQSLFALLKDSRFDTNPSITKTIELKQKIWRNAIRLDQICLVSYGARLNNQTANIGKEHYLSAKRFAGAKQFCEGQNIKRYSFTQNGWLRYRPKEHYRPVFPEVFENAKLMSINVVKDELRFAYDEGGTYNSHTVVNCVRLDLLTGATHRSATSALRKADLELARSYDYKFLLGVLNSTLINWYFVNFLSEDLHFYPNDAKELPIPTAFVEQQAEVVKLVDEILAAKSADANADTRHLEWQIDRLVYDLYGLTEEEDTAVERALGLIHQTDEEEDEAIGRAIDAALAENPDGFVSEETIMATLHGLNGD